MLRLAIPLVLLLPTTAAAQSALMDKLLQMEPPQRSERIMQDFVPDPARMEAVTGEEMRELYTGRKVRGVYFDTFLSEQRYTEAYTSDTKTRYVEGDIATDGDWKVEGDTICFQYAELDSPEFCFREFRYGDCFVVYDSSLPLKGGKPMFPERWNSVNRFTTDDFAWPEAVSEDDALACEIFVS